MALSHEEIATLLGLKQTRAGESLGNRGESRLRMVGAAAGPQAVPSDLGEPPAGARLPVSQTEWTENAILRPGLEVRLVDIADGGAVLETPSRLHNNTRMELHLTSADGARRISVPCWIRRCLVAGLRPLRFHAAVVFDHDIDALADPGSSPDTSVGVS